MVFLFFGLCILVLAGGLWHLAARPKGGRYGWQALWRLACRIGAVRIGAGGAYIAYFAMCAATGRQPRFEIMRVWVLG